MKRVCPSSSTKRESAWAEMPSDLVRVVAAHDLENVKALLFVSSHFYVALCSAPPSFWEKSFRFFSERKNNVGYGIYRPVGRETWRNLLCNLPQLTLRPVLTTTSFVYECGLKMFDVLYVQPLRHPEFVCRNWDRIPHFWFDIVGNPCPHCRVPILFHAHNNDAPIILAEVTLEFVVGAERVTFARDKTTKRLVKTKRRAVYFNMNDSLLEMTHYVTPTERPFRSFCYLDELEQAVAKMALRDDYDLH